MRYSDSVRMAIRSTRSYWKGCIFDRLKTEAMKDHKRALNEIIKSGYTWGLKHQLPFEWESLKRAEIISIRNSLYPRRNHDFHRNSEANNTERRREYARN